MFTWDIIPKSVPASSPLERLILELTVTASLPANFTLVLVPEALAT